MVRPILVAFFVQELFLDFDTAALDQHQLIALTRLTGCTDIDLARGVDGILVARWGELHADIVRGYVLIALITSGSRQAKESGQHHGSGIIETHRIYSLRSTSY